MNSLMICVVSENNVPNYRVFVQYLEKITHVILIKSELSALKNKTKLLKETMERKIKNDPSNPDIQIEVYEDKINGDTSEDYQKLEKFVHAKVDPEVFDQIYLNCTGGTKYFIMMLENLLSTDAYRDKTKFVYKPVNMDDYYIWDHRHHHSSKRLEPISILNHLSLYSETSIKEDLFDYTRFPFENLKKYFNDFNQTYVINLEKNNGKSEAENEEIYLDKVKSFLSSMGLLEGLGGDNASKKNIISFFNGIWLEVYMAQLFGKIPNFTTERNILLEGENNENNELDFVFLIKDKLHIIECKAYFENPYNDLLNYSYKLSGVMKKIGFPSGYLVMPTYFAKSFFDFSICDGEDPDKRYNKLDNYNNLLKYGKSLNIEFVFEPEKYISNTGFKRTLISPFHWSEYKKTKYSLTKNKLPLSEELQNIYLGKKNAGKRLMTPHALYENNIITILAYYCSDDNWFIVSDQEFKNEGLVFNKCVQNFNNKDTYSAFQNIAPFKWHSNIESQHKELYFCIFKDDTITELQFKNTNLSFSFELPYICK